VAARACNRNCPTWVPKGNDMLNPGVLRFNAGGRIRTSNTAPSEVNGGTPTLGGLLSTINSAATVFVHGMGYPSTGQLAGTVAGAVSYFNEGLAFTSANRVCLDEAGAITGYLGGLPRVATGALATAAPE
jgi:hypothetical protein